MPVAPDLFRVALSANIQDGEAMVHSLWIKNVAPIGTGGLQGLADGLVLKWREFLQVPISGGAVGDSLCQRTVYRKASVYQVSPVTGRAVDIAESNFLPTDQGTSLQAAPTELAICVSLKTGKPGRRNNGRLYLGGLQPGLIGPTNGRLTATPQLVIAASMARFLRGVRMIGVSTGQQDIWEPHIHSTKFGVSSKITTVSVGDVFDVQRRRRNKLSEARVSSAVG